MGLEALEGGGEKPILGSHCGRGVGEEWVVQHQKDPTPIADFADEGRGHKPSTVGKLQKMEKARIQTVF